MSAIDTEEAAPVMAIGEWKNNAELIRDCACLGYLNKRWKTLDPTYGLGRFWTLWRPDELIACDLEESKSPLGFGVDFRDLPWSDAEFDAVVFDPPYKLNHGGGSHPSDEGYGVALYGVRPDDRHALIRDGITECLRVLKKRCMLLVKCQDQVVSGHVRWQTREFADHAESLGCRLVDMLHLPSYRPQPPGRVQVHARRNYSSLLVLQKATA